MTMPTAEQVEHSIEILSASNPSIADELRYLAAILKQSSKGTDALVSDLCSMTVRGVRNETR